jgi:3-hydroxy-9,10-secoandrosta-1,3,5(10)-triene-9,17-dione monooxygenase
MDKARNRKRDRRIVIEPPEPDLTPEALVERARALRPLLREQQAEADTRGHYSDEVHEAIKRAGLYRAVQPRMFGGYELDIPTLLKLSLEISHGHPSSGWCYTLATSHALLVGSHLSEEAQGEIFGPDGDFRCPAKAPPSGTFTRTDGGYIVNGTWTFSSGIPVSNYFMGGGVILDDAGQPARSINFIVARDKITMLDDWGGDVSLGMQGSGSNSVRVEDVFVPDRHFFDAGILLVSAPDGSGTPGTALHGNPMYLGVAGGVYHATFGAILTGAARAALDEYEQVVQHRPVFSNPSVKQKDDPESQQIFGKATQLTDAAEALTLACGRIYMEQCERWAATGQPITKEDTMRLWGTAQEACQMACRAVDLLFRTAGAFNARPGQKMNRYFRDIQMYRIHPSAQPAIATSIGQIRLGGELVNFSDRAFTDMAKADRGKY